jgi:hypothetical protein
MNAGILSLSFRGVFWSAPTSSSNTTLSILQFVAKIHEGLILLSLTSIILHRICYEVLNRDGILFGLLNSALQYSSWMILMRKDFWRSVANLQQVYRYPGVMTLTLTAFALAATVGPSAAIAVLPRLEWWSVHFPTSFQNNTFPIIYLKTTTGPTFSGVVIAAPSYCNSCDVPETCSGSNATSLYWCPSSGISTILRSGLVYTNILNDVIVSPAQIIIPTCQEFIPVGSSARGSVFYSRSLNGNILRTTTGSTSNNVFVASVILDTTAIAFRVFSETQTTINSPTRPMVKTPSSPIVSKPSDWSSEAVGSNPMHRVSSKIHKLDHRCSHFPSTYHYPASTSTESWT